MILNGSEYIGGVDEFMLWALKQFRYTDKTSILIYRKMAGDAHRAAHNDNPGRSYIKMFIGMENLMEP